MKIKIKKYILFIVVFIFIYTIFIGFSIYLYSRTNEIVEADAAIVLGAAVWGEKPSPVFRERIDHAIRLYKSNIVSKIIFTGGKDEVDKYAESYVAKMYALENGVEERDIFIETKSQITEQNIYYAKQIAEQNGINTFIIVSDPLHMKRAMLMAKDYDLISFTSPTTTTKYKSWKSKLKFLLREIIFYSGYLIKRLFK
jgi:uncharacterized SAM-binding protein YcdF (DUF218 family)